MSPTPRRSEPKGCSWELSHSLWVLWTFFLMPCVGFFIIGRRMRYKPWLIAGALYLVALAIIFSMLDETGQSTSETAGGLETLYYLVSIVHTFIARSKYLKMLNEEEEGDMEYTRQQQTDDQRAAAFAQQYNMHAQQKEGPRQQTTPRRPATGSPHSQQAPTDNTGTTTSAANTAGLSVVNINTASKTQLESLPGISAVMALQAIKYRHAHQGFSSVEEFFEVTKLKPHFIIQLQDRLVCQPATSPYSGSTGGRPADGEQPMGTSSTGSGSQPSGDDDNPATPRGRQLDL